MSPKELKDLVKTMRKLGVTHYKAGDVELNIEAASAQKPKPRKLTKDEENKIKDTTEELKSVMGLNDDQLLDRLFPFSKEEEAGQ